MWLGRRQSVAFAIALSFFVRAGPAAAAPCGDMTLRFFDNMPANPPVFLQPGEAPEHEIAQMQVFVNGSRSMGSPFWTASYWILPLITSAGTATGESYWIAEADSPVLEIEFQRDRDGRVTREILLGPQPRNQTASGNANRMQGWYSIETVEIRRCRPRKSREAHELSSPVQTGFPTTEVVHADF